MPSAVDVEIADAVADALSIGSFTLPMDPIRSYAEWDEALEDFNTLHVDVVPTQPGPVLEQDDRARVQYTCSIDIGVRYRFGPLDQRTLTGQVDRDSADQLKLLVQEIAEYFMADRLDDSNVATLGDPEILFGWNRRHLRQNRQFFGLVRLKVEATKTIRGESEA